LDLVNESDDAFTVGILDDVLPLSANALSIESLGSSPSLKQTGVPLTVLQLQSSASFNLPHFWQVSSFFLVYDK